MFFQCLNITPEKFSLEEVSYLCNIIHLRLSFTRFVKLEGWSIDGICDSVHLYCLCPSMDVLQCICVLMSHYVCVYTNIVGRFCVYNSGIRWKVTDRVQGYWIVGEYPSQSQTGNGQKNQVQLYSSQTLPHPTNVHFSKHTCKFCLFVFSKPKPSRKR